MRLSWKNIAILAIGCGTTVGLLAIFHPSEETLWTWIPLGIGFAVAFWPDGKKTSD